MSAPDTSRPSCHYSGRRQRRLPRWALKIHCGHAFAEAAEGRTKYTVGCEGCTHKLQAEMLQAETQED